MNEYYPVLSQPEAISAAFSIGASNESIEHVADAMADKVMRMPEQNFIRRKCSACKDDEKGIQRKPLTAFIQRKESSAEVMASDTVSSKIHAGKGSGHSLDSNTLSFMQNRFGADFSGVKIHTGSESIQMNRELNAKAFTVGNDIYFNQGEYSPGTNKGKHLLAHELTHTVQQNEKVNNDNPVLRRQSIGDYIPTGLRRLKQEERSIAKGVYGNSLAYSMIFISNAIGADNREYTLHVGNKITVIQVGSTAYNSIINTDKLIHELAHSWQCQHGITGFEYMYNSIASQALGGDEAYCYIPGKPFGRYGAEQIASQAENGIPAIVNHMKGTTALMPDLANMVGLSIPRWEKRGDPQVNC